MKKYKINWIMELNETELKILLALECLMSLDTIHHIVILQLS